MKTLNSLKARNKKEGKEKNWAKILKKTESYKEIFNLFDKVDKITSSSGDKPMGLLSGQGWNDTMPGGGDRHESTWPFPQCEFKVCTADDIFVFEMH